MKRGCVVQKADPTKQGLKPLSALAIKPLTSRPKGRSNKTRIETTYGSRLRNPIDQVQKADPTKQGLKRFYG